MDKSLYALKGGCNLRFFFKSIRYSEDIDFDVRVVAPETLKKKIDKILAGSGLRKMLLNKGLQIEHISAPKQTETTQRWKIQLLSRGSSMRIPTKIEFSRRKRESAIEFGPIDPELIRHYHLYPVLCSHYSKESARRKKWEALLGRQATQSRDVFDLHQLLQGENAFPSTKKVDFEEIEKKVHSLSFDDFKGQVVAYLQPEYQSYYDDPKRWMAIQAEIIAHGGGGSR